MNERYKVYNPKNKLVEELPIIYGFNNGGGGGLMMAQLIAEDGTELGGHACSSEGFMLRDLGILKGTRDDRHETFKKHCPDGYRMDFVSYDEVDEHEALQKAFKLNKENNPKAKGSKAEVKITFTN